MDGTDQASEVTFKQSTLVAKLASALPSGINFKIYHISTPPSQATPLFAAPPASRPDRTYCESHFLSVSIVPPEEGDTIKKGEVLVYALEVLIYSTAYDTTFFVSKADSTGFLHLLKLRRGTSSPIKDITSNFLRHLIETHHRPGLRSIISLFARAQDQYLFPGSVEYSGKHVLNDRGLVRWWCRVLDPVLQHLRSVEFLSCLKNVQGFLTIPGLDARETVSYIPKESAQNDSWTVGHPLLEISRHVGQVPPRCLIPHFPDDPKTRFLDELDEEISKAGDSNGRWKSVKSLEQFWDMMAHRQECSAGRLVGFLWIVLNPNRQLQYTEDLLTDSQTSSCPKTSSIWDIKSNHSKVRQNLPFDLTPLSSFDASSQVNPSSSTFEEENSNAHSISRQPTRPCHSQCSKAKKLTGPIIPRQPRVKTENRKFSLEFAQESAYYSWRPICRGQIVVDESDYKRVTELLLRLDFANIDLAASSSSRWISEVSFSVPHSMRDDWGQVVAGTKVVQTQPEAGAAGVSTLNTSLVRKKRKGSPSRMNPDVNVLPMGMMRKPPKG